MRFLIGIILVLMLFGAGAYVRWSAKEPSAPEGPSAVGQASLQSVPAESDANVVVAAPRDGEAADEGAGSSREALEPMRRDVRNVTPDRVLPGPEIDAELIRRLPAIEPPAPPQKPPKPVRWQRTTILAAGHLRSADTTIVLSGIDPLEVDAMCRADDGREWPCGNFARAAFQRLVRGRPVLCDPLDEAQTAAAEAGGATIITHCSLAGHDLGLWLVRQGWARPGDTAPSDYASAMDAAREARRGQWRREALADIPADDLVARLPVAPTETGPLVANDADAAGDTAGIISSGIVPLGIEAEEAEPSGDGNY